MKADRLWQEDELFALAKLVNPLPSGCWGQPGHDPRDIELGQSGGHLLRQLASSNAESAAMCALVEN